MGAGMADEWREAWSVKGFRAALVSGLAGAVAVVVVLPRFFEWVGMRPGTRPWDPLLASWGPMDVSAATFIVLYASLLLAVISALRYPFRMLQGLWAYVLMLALRMAAMAVFTLEPPRDIIPLVDPFTQNFYPGESPFLKDLFFSGHTATLVLMALLSPRGPVRWLVALGALAVAMLVLAQHVHWTVDVLAAVPAAWLAWASAGALMRRLAVSEGAQ